MKNTIGEFLFPGLSEETQKIIDEDSIRNIEYISPADNVALFGDVSPCTLCLILL